MKEKLSEKLELFKKMMLAGDFPCGFACDFCKYGDICNHLNEPVVFGLNVADFVDTEVDGGDSL